MSQENKPAPPVPQAKVPVGLRPRRKIPLPQDKFVRLFVLAIASGFSMVKLYEPILYLNEVQVQMINGLSNMPRHMHTNYVTRLAAEKRDQGQIGDVVIGTRISRPPNLVTLFAVFIGVVAIMAYGQYSGQLGVWYNGLVTGTPYLVAGIIFLFAIVLLSRRRKRRPVS